VKHPFNQQLFTYWTELRGTRAAPERSDIEPGAIRRLLSNSFVLSCEDGSDGMFRVAGTRLCALFGQELRDKPFTTIWDTASAADVGELCMIVAEEGVGVVAGAQARSVDDLSCSVEALLLPLLLNGKLGARILGLAVPLEQPFWLGIWPVKPLRLGIIQFVGPAVAPRHGGLPPASIRRGLTVIEGGRT